MDLNNANYKMYMERMDTSYTKTTKGLIPMFAKGKTLDVGCGSGVLLRQLKDAKGIDLNPKAVGICKEQNLNAECISLHDVEGTYDTIIFSSVLHEFSSYDDHQRYTEWPILEALKDANRKLNEDGQIIIRDGIKGKKLYATLTAKNAKVVEDFKKYVIDAPMWDNDTFVVYDDLKITAPIYLLKEFMFTYTWGPDSYPREVQEQYGILRPGKWLDLVSKAGFKVTCLKIKEEEYADYLSEHFESDDTLEYIFKDSTIFLVAKKCKAI